MRPRQIHAERWSVLLVEDDPGTRDVLSKHLVRAGFTVTAIDRAELLPEERERNGRPFDVVVSDVHLPGMSGIELASLLLASTPAQPIVLITGDPDEALAREALSRGPVSYLLKPFQLFELEAAIRNTLASSAYRHDAPPPGTSDFMIGAVPAEWLRWVDERSYAGAGHGERVARLCRALADELNDDRIDADELELAAYSHEIGIMRTVAADPIELAVQSAELLRDLGSSPGVVRAVRHLYERWDGSGGPDQLHDALIPDSARVLSVADAIDHYTASWVKTGVAPIDAVDRAIGLVLVQQETVFSAAVVRAVSNRRPLIRSICGVGRAGPTERDTREEQGVYSIVSALPGRLA
jgi:response regulator RpfG family c-di-GMP phosphodiesterase